MNNLNQVYHYVHNTTNSFFSFNGNLQFIFFTLFYIGIWILILRIFDNQLYGNIYKGHFKIFKRISFILLFLSIFPLIWLIGRNTYYGYNFISDNNIISNKFINRKLPKIDNLSNLKNNIYNNLQNNHYKQYNITNYYYNYNKFTADNYNQLNLKQKEYIIDKLNKYNNQFNNLNNSNKKLNYLNKILNLKISSNTLNQELPISKSKVKDFKQLNIGINIGNSYNVKYYESNTNWYYKQFYNKNIQKQIYKEIKQVK